MRILPGKERMILRILSMQPWQWKLTLKIIVTSPPPFLLSLLFSPPPPPPPPLFFPLSNFGNQQCKSKKNKSRIHKHKIWRNREKDLLSPLTKQKKSSKEWVSGENGWQRREKLCVAEGINKGRWGENQCWSEGKGGKWNGRRMKLGWVMWVGRTEAEPNFTIVQVCAAEAPGAGEKECCCSTRTVLLDWLVPQVLLMPTLLIAIPY